MGIIAAAGVIRFFSEDKIASDFKPFQDVSAKDKNYSAIVYLSREKVLEADQDGKFNPQKILSRAEWIAMLINLIGIVPEPSLSRPRFAPGSKVLYLGDTANQSTEKSVY